MEILCFDMDNTLVKSNRLHLFAFRKAFKEYKLPYKTTKEIIDLFGLKGDILIKKLYPKLTQKKIKEIMKYHNKIVIKNAHKYITIIPGVKSTLKKLRPHYKIAVLSNCSHKEIEAILKAAKIDNYDTLIGTDDVKFAKPAPDEIFKAEKLLHIKKGYMIGDSIYDVKAGKKAKIKTISVTTGDHTIKELKKEKPDKILKSVKELPKYLLKK